MEYFAKSFRQICELYIYDQCLYLWHWWLYSNWCLRINDLLYTFQMICKNIDVVDCVNHLGISQKLLWKRCRERQPRIEDFWDTAWRQMLRNHEDQNISNISWLTGSNLSWLILKKQRVPLKLKVLVALRILGRNNKMDDINELNSNGPPCHPYGRTIN